MVDMVKFRGEKDRPDAESEGQNRGAYQYQTLKLTNQANLFGWFELMHTFMPNGRTLVLI